MKNKSVTLKEAETLLKTMNRPFPKTTIRRAMMKWASDLHRLGRKTE